MKSTTRLNARRIATNTTLRTLLTCVAVCAVRSLSVSTSRNPKSCCD
ncbi:hypothetical protein D806_060910 [Mycolicibacterium smegmatis MKD8]|uniref:Uncharacterized protein n=1 Tax=Mycolicibacterium smegmatis (strain MKD8) TaxID=1214915 RepID=A0A2U9PYX7_MYCSE|nr:hypothetical protein D806_060910 [Mycolicibacterium smegmatis MKD8]